MESIDDFLVMVTYNFLKYVHVFIMNEVYEKRNPLPS